jgi:hypothetical protein
MVGCKTISSLGLEQGNFWKLLDTAMGSEKHSQAERHNRNFVSPRCKNPRVINSFFPENSLVYGFDELLNSTLLHDFGRNKSG